MRNCGYTVRLNVCKCRLMCPVLSKYVKVSISYEILVTKFLQFLRLSKFEVNLCKPGLVLLSGTLRISDLVSGLPSDNSKWVKLLTRSGNRCRYIVRPVLLRRTPARIPGPVLRRRWGRCVDAPFSGPVVIVASVSTTWFSCVMG